jgi:hypothetical protein
MVSRIASALLALCLTSAAQVLMQSSGTASPSPAESGSTDTPPPLTCPAGGPLGDFDLQVVSAGNQPLPFRTIIHLTEGDTVKYNPVTRGKEKREGEISLVLVPEKHVANSDALIVTDPKPANKPQEWKIDQTISIAAYVYGPDGLSKRKVKGFLERDDLLIAQLADYAAKTSQTEALIEALSNTESSSASINAALSGFASQYGVSAAIDKTAPPATQAQALFSSINPQLATYDPLTTTTSARIGQTASLTTAAASLFFGSPVGLAAGGTAMLLDLHALAFPGMQFRSSFAQPAPKGLSLCGQRTPGPPHTRLAYIWANRIPNANTPNLEIGKANFLPLKQKTAVPIASVVANDWKYLDRARNWTLEGASQKKSSIPVIALANQKSLELDLSKADLPAGDYRLVGYWDWQRFETKGSINLRPLSDFSNARLSATSQDRLLARSGKIPVTLENSDFEFTTKVEMKRLGDEFAAAETVPFLLPKGLRQGPQQSMDVQINTSEQDPGDLQLLISQQDGTPHPVAFKILPNPPQITNLPVLANQGEALQHYMLKGDRLALVTKLSSPGAELVLGEATSGGKERPLTVKLAANANPGQSFPVVAELRDRHEPVTFADGLRITGPVPLIASSKLSPPAGLPVSLKEGEWPAGETLSALLDVKNAEAGSTLRLGCLNGSVPETTLRIGGQTDRWSLQELSPDQLFLTSDTKDMPAGCVIQAKLDNGAGGTSTPFTLATIVRLPRIQQFVPVPDPGTDAKSERAYELTGRNLETIEKIGWDQLNGLPVTNLPAPVPGGGQLQTLRVDLPDTGAQSGTVYLWLRGETVGRSTTVSLTSKDGHVVAPAR